MPIILPMIAALFLIGGKPGMTGDMADRLARIFEGKLQ